MVLRCPVGQFSICLLEARLCYIDEWVNMSAGGQDCVPLTSGSMFLLEAELCYIDQWVQCFCLRQDCVY